MVSASVLLSSPAYRYIPVVVVRSCFYANTLRYNSLNHAPAPPGASCVVRTSARLPRCFAFVPWFTVILFTLMAAATTVLATSANDDATDQSSKVLRLPCNCRISHNTNQTSAWLLLIVVQVS